MSPNINTTTTKTLPNLPLATVIRLAFTYFGVVFSTGFLFGTIRQLYIIPMYHLPSSKAEIIEAPLMFIAVIVWANWLVNHYKTPPKPTVRLAVGLLGLGVMACVEFMGSRFVGERGPVEESEEEWAGLARALYLFDLMVFGVMPWILMLMEKKQKAE
ncbi:hypothetical protein BKA65DRAFT_535677 [Rhexocercosporidium sp. MPI-PUGE-AT-0058]|nr:hypothetical protein BKA65DRAFT_535677 [Rhexocercosporidium sp. MPI-PUGE-AT-0058]